MAYMEVLLREDVENLGDRGQVVRVRRGYGRNFLLPRGLAVQASVANVRQIDSEKRVLAKREAKERSAAESAAKGFDGLTLTFERKAGEEGKLFGSVSTIDIAHALEEAGKTVDRHRIRLKDPIKQVGEYKVPVKLHRDIVSTLTIVVTPEGGVLPTAEAAAPAELPGYVPPGDPGPSARSNKVDEDDDEDYDDYES